MAKSDMLLRKNLRENILKERKYEGKNFKYDYTFQPNNCNNNLPN